jgi:hypothetical protein
LTVEKKAKPTRAKELLHSLGPMSGWEAQREERVQKLNELRRLLDEQEGPLIAELFGVGVRIGSVSDLVNRHTPYPMAIPILLKHLSLPYHENIADMIARALAVPEAGFAWDFIVSEYKRTPHLRPDGLDSQKKNALAVAVTGALPPDRWEDFVALVQDKSNGSSRILMLRKIERSKREDSDELFDELAKDKDLALEIGEFRKRRLQRRTLAKAKKNLQ